MLLSPTLSNPIQSRSGWESSNNAGGPVPPSHCCYQGCGSGSHVGFPKTTRAGISAVSPTSPLHLPRKAKPSLLGSQPFPSETSCPGRRAGSNQLDFFQSPVTKQLAGALREEIFSAATDQVATTQPLSVHLRHPACPGRNADSTPKAAPFQSTSFPSNSTGITIRYCNIIS